MTRRGVVVVLSLLGATLSAVFFLLPDYLARKAIDEAAASGIVLTIARSQVRVSGLRFFGLEARLRAVPGVMVTIEEATAPWAGLSAPKRVHLRGVVATVPDLAQLQAGGTRIESALEHVEFEGAKVQIGATGMSMELAGCSGALSKAPELGDEYRFRAETVKGLLGASTFGPWKLTSERATGSGTTRLALGGQDADVTLVTRADSKRIEVKIPRSHVHALGLPASAFGLAPADDPEIDLRGRASYLSPTDAGEGNLDFHLFGYSVGFIPSPVDIALATQWRGSGQSAKIDRATFSVGPFGGTAQGTIDGPYPTFRMALTFESTPVSCDRFGRQAAGGLLDLLGSATGKTVTGEVKLAGSLVFDLTHPEGNRLNLKPSADCSFTL
jgi:hypothetical protein